MTDSTTKVDTKFGRVEVDTVECSSCGNEVLRKEAEEFTLGDTREGWACPVCVEEGPAGFPDKVEASLKEFNGEGADFWLYLMFGWLLFPLIAIFMTAEKFFGTTERLERNEDSSNWFFRGVWATIFIFTVYACLLALLAVLIGP